MVNKDLPQNASENLNVKIHIKTPISQLPKRRIGKILDQKSGKKKKRVSTQQENHRWRDYYRQNYNSNFSTGFSWAWGSLGIQMGPERVRILQNKNKDRIPYMFYVLSYPKDSQEQNPYPLLRTPWFLIWYSLPIKLNRMF